MYCGCGCLSISPPPSPLFLLSSIPTLCTHPTLPYPTLPRTFNGHGHEQTDRDIKMSIFQQTRFGSVRSRVSLLLLLLLLLGPSVNLHVVPISPLPQTLHPFCAYCYYSALHYKRASDTHRNSRFSCPTTRPSAVKSSKKNQCHKEKNKAQLFHFFFFYFYKPSSFD